MSIRTAAPDRRPVAVLFEPHGHGWAAGDRMVLHHPEPQRPDELR